MRRLLPGERPARLFPRLLLPSPLRRFLSPPRDRRLLPALLPPSDPSPPDSTGFGLGFGFGNIGAVPGRSQPRWGRCAGTAGAGAGAGPDDAGAGADEDGDGEFGTDWTPEGGLLAFCGVVLALLEEGLLAFAAAAHGAFTVLAAATGAGAGLEFFLLPAVSPLPDGFAAAAAAAAAFACAASRLACFFLLFFPCTAPLPFPRASA